MLEANFDDRQRIEFENKLEIKLGFVTAPSDTVHKYKTNAAYLGLSKISIELQPTIDPDYMPVKWDELRRKVANIQPKLPSGASTHCAFPAR